MIHVDIPSFLLGYAVGAFAWGFAGAAWRDYRSSKKQLAG